jgi:hypothetical protein
VPHHGRYGDNIEITFGEPVAAASTTAAQVKEIVHCTIFALAIRGRHR